MSDFDRGFCVRCWNSRIFHPAVHKVKYLNFQQKKIYWFLLISNFICKTNFRGKVAPKCGIPVRGINSTLFQSMVIVYFKGFFPGHILPLLNFMFYGNVENRLRSNGSLKMFYAYRYLLTDINLSKMNTKNPNLQRIGNQRNCF